MGLFGGSKHKAPAFDTTFGELEKGDTIYYKNSNSNDDIIEFHFENFENVMNTKVQMSYRLNDDRNIGFCQFNRARYKDAVAVVNDGFNTCYYYSMNEVKTLIKNKPMWYVYTPNRAIAEIIYIR